MLHTISSHADAPQRIRRFGGGGPRRIAENAGLVITRGEGSFLIGDDGRRYLDLATAMGVAALGHGHDRWADAVAEQSRRLAACILHTPQQAAYLEALAGVLPSGLGRTALYSGGAEAVEVAVRLAQSATGRRHVLTFATGFHGKTAGVRYAGARFAHERAWLGVDWVHAVPYPECHSHHPLDYPACPDRGEAARAALERLADELDGDVAAVLLEPILGTAGNRPPERLFCAELAALCRRRGWLLIADESITGFGRLGTMFASEWYGIEPDILVMGKAMGAGFPLSGVAARSELWDHSLFAEPSATSSSYGANPVACAAGLAVLSAIAEEALLENARTAGRRLAEGLVALSAHSPYVRRVRGVGLMLGFDLVDPATGELAGPELALRLFRRLLDHGLLVAQVPAVRLNAPLTLAPTEVDLALEAMAAALGDDGRR